MCLESAPNTVVLYKIAYMQETKNSPYSSDAGMPIEKVASDHPVHPCPPFLSSFFPFHILFLSLFPFVPFPSFQIYHALLFYFHSKIINNGIHPFKAPYILFETENHRFEQYSKILEVDRYIIRRSFDFPPPFFCLVTMDIILSNIIILENNIFLFDYHIFNISEFTRSLDLCFI